MFLYAPRFYLLKGTAFLEGRSQTPKTGVAKPLFALGFGVVVGLEDFIDGRVGSEQWGVLGFNGRSNN